MVLGGTGGSSGYSRVTDAGHYYIHLYILPTSLPLPTIPAQHSSPTAPYPLREYWGYTGVGVLGIGGSRWSVQGIVGLGYVSTSIHTYYYHLHPTLLPLYYPAFPRRYTLDRKGV